MRVCSRSMRMSPGNRPNHDSAPVQASTPTITTTRPSPTRSGPRSRPIAVGRLRAGWRQAGAHRTVEPGVGAVTDRGLLGRMQLGPHLGDVAGGAQYRIEFVADEKRCVGVERVVLLRRIQLRPQFAGPVEERDDDPSTGTGDAAGLSERASAVRDETQRSQERGVAELGPPEGQLLGDALDDLHVTLAGEGTHLR